MRNLDHVLNRLLVEGVFDQGKPDMRSAAEEMSVAYSAAITQRLLMKVESLEYCIHLSLLPYSLGSNHHFNLMSGVQPALTDD